MSGVERAPARDPLSAVPVVLETTRSAPLANGEGLLLSRREAPRGWLSSWLERRLGLRRERRFELDALGARFFLAIDGRRDLSGIQRALVRELGVEERAAREAVIAFTAELMRRGLIALSVPARPERRTDG
jgi:hypothetical protein